MRAVVVATVMAMTLGVSACGSDSSSADTTTAGTLADGVPNVVGQSVDDATATLEAAGFTLRVVKRDGEDLPATADFVETRVNVAVESQAYGSEVVTEVVSTG